MLTKEIVTDRLLQLQQSICTALENEDGVGKFSTENWNRDGGGGGVTRILQQGGVIEKGGVNFSAVHGELPNSIKKELKIEDVQIWEQIYFESGGTGLYAAWDPYAEMYLITKNLHAKDLENRYTEIFYGKNAGNRAYKKAIDLGMPIVVNKVWVEDEEMWKYV